ncbi:MAG: hypothetical protein M3O30_17670 [Planctomycetota bacterium]|nr:hypothetical protein [Planctomycetota bacterium]
MADSRHKGLNRRAFLMQAGVVAGGVAAGLLDGFNGPSIQTAKADKTLPVAPPGPGIALVCDPADTLVSAPPVQWALGELRKSLESRGIPLQLCQRLEQAGRGQFCILASDPHTQISREMLAGATVEVARKAESLALVPTRRGEQSILLATAGDARGMVYAVMELTDRVNHSADARGSLQLAAPITEQPANRIRSAMRLFASDVEDKGWFNDRDFWQRYLTMLVTNRFNRFNLALGLGYDRPRKVTDTYFYFAYPFLLDVPGYSVRARGLADGERDQNLKMLQFISSQAAARGLQFQLGIWTHTYQWIDSPRANYIIEGLTPQTQGPYSRDALHMLLEACPDITGVTFRVHGESGIAEGSYDFWKQLFSGIVQTGRKIEIDMHAKGMDQKMLDVAAATGLPVVVSPKLSAEHMGLPSIPSSIRKTELPTDKPDGGFFSLSSGSRSFLRYGYGDLLTRDRGYGILHRIWPGTQRLLLWGDPTYAAGYSRAAGFCGSDGLEIFEPLSFKGRMGSGLPGGRDGYADASLRPAGGEWEKFLYSYRLWGRLTYNPDCTPDVWQRHLQKDLGPAAQPMESALARSSRILPLITAAHDPSAANATYWPEMYLNMSIVEGSSPNPYSDTPKPRIFSNVSSVDPQMFASISEFVAGLFSGQLPAKYSPLEVAGQLESWLDASGNDLLAAKASVAASPGYPTPAFRRAEIDISIANSIGKFFAHKIRAAALYVVFDRTGHEPSRQEALKAYRQARAAWAELSERAKGVYVANVAFGSDSTLHGNWADRLPAIDKDIAVMETHASSAGETRPNEKEAAAVMSELLAPSARSVVDAHHQAPAGFTLGREVNLELKTSQRDIAAARLWYRHVNQAELYKSVEMQRQGDVYQASIPADYTNSPFSLQYYFELRQAVVPAPSAVTQGAMYPGFGADFTGQPYYVLSAV